MNQRLRRCVEIATLLGIAAAVLGMFPGLQLAGGRTMPSGGTPLVGMVALVVLYGAWLWAAPSKLKALIWSAATFVICTGWLISTLFRQDDLASIARWPYHATWTLMGAMLFVAGPVVALVVWAGDRREVPTARVIS